MEEEQEYGNERKSTKGYQIVIVILALILAALSYMYYTQTNSMKSEFAIQRDTLSNQLERLVGDMQDLKTSNDTISYSLGIERSKADSLLQSLQKERSFSAAKIRQYEKELGTLRIVMRGFVQQIDSLNTINRSLAEKNVGLERDLATERVEKDRAIEKADELNVKVRQGAVIKARNINLLALNSGDKEVTRASRAARMRVDFVLGANDIASLGQRNVYSRIQGPDGYQMTVAGSPTFEYEGHQTSFSATREVDYQGTDLPVSLYYTGGGITEGTYRVAIYMDGHLIGSNEIILR